MRTIARILSSATRAALIGKRTTARLVAPLPYPRTWDEMSSPWASYTMPWSFLS